MAQVVTIMTTIMNTPTSMPVVKSLPMDTLPVVPKMIMAFPGGTVAVISPVKAMLQAMKPVA